MVAVNRGLLVGFDNAHMSQKFAQWFKSQLDRREWNQSDFARRTGISQTTVSTWVRSRSVPDPASCDIIADVFLLPLDEVLAVAGHRPVETRSHNEAAAAIAAMVRRVNWTADRVAGIEAILRQWAEVDRRDRE